MNLPNLDPQSGFIKWSLPGWRPEKKYKRDVLIGNWYEERLQLDASGRFNQMRESDYQRHSQTVDHFNPEVFVRKQSFLSTKGLSKDKLFGHHGNMYTNNTITWYDQEFNKRERPASQFLPSIRRWNGRSLEWEPQKTDYPLQGVPTNWGLLQRTKARHSRDMIDARVVDYNSSYNRSFSHRPSQGVQKRLARPFITKHSSPAALKPSKLALSAPIVRELEAPSFVV